MKGREKWSTNERIVKTRSWEISLLRLSEMMEVSREGENRRIQKR